MKPRERGRAGDPERDPVAIDAGRDRRKENEPDLPVDVAGEAKGADFRQARDP
jgi:hypothetical protein